MVFISYSLCLAWYFLDAFFKKYQAIGGQVVVDK